MTDAQREIKFRAWDKQINIITDVVCLNLGTWNDVILVHPDSKIVRRQETYNQKTENIVLMQSTGLLDKNGKEIFDGDVVTWAGMRPLEISFGWGDTNEDYGKSYGILIGSSVFCDINQDCEIIGNLYENPELLTQKEV